MEIKRVTASGASGFLGKELVKKFIELGYEVTAIGHSEWKTVVGNKDAKWEIGDITDEDFCDTRIKGDLVIHAAAQKHVPVAESNPVFSVKNNIIGTLNVFRSAIKNRVKEVVFISTDKAYEPETIYGKTKEFGEWLCKYYNNQDLETKFYWCKYGNVGGSSGSVFEIWDKLGKEGKDLKITVPDMTRFFFGIDDAVKTILKTLKNKNLKKPYIPKMKAMVMKDACEVFCEYYGVKYEIIGNRGNEKKHEAMSKNYESKNCQRFTKREIKIFLRKLGLLKK
jgi:UDP-N-acetylglucosamine 4,6-dehydratase